MGDGEPSLVDEVPDSLECQLCRVLATFIQATLHLLRWGQGHRDLGNFGWIPHITRSAIPVSCHLWVLRAVAANMTSEETSRCFPWVGMCVRASCKRMRDLAQGIQLRENGSRKRHRPPLRVTLPCAWIQEANSSVDLYGPHPIVPCWFHLLYSPYHRPKKRPRHRVVFDVLRQLRQCDGTSPDHHPGECWLQKCLAGCPPSAMQHWPRHSRRSLKPVLQQ